MPEGKVGVSNRMVYASSQSNLKSAVGFSAVVDTLQFSLRDEVLGREPETPAPQTGAAAAAPATSIAPPQEQKEQQLQQPKTQPQQANVTSHPQAQAQAQTQTQAVGNRGVFVKKLDPRLAMSKSELEHVDMLKQEDDARSEQLQQMRTHFRNYTTPSRPDITPNNQHANDSGIKQTVAAASGGFHTVSLPLSPSAKSALSSFSCDDSISVVELQVEANKCVTEVKSYAEPDGFSPSANEPRFYIIRAPGSRVFVYCCPEGSAPRLRMVYSTATARTLAQIQELGCQLTHKLSVFSAKECTASAVAAAVRSGQAQRVDSDKSVDTVVNYVPSKPARSLPSRFAANTTRTLDAFTDEEGFRKAFSGVRPDAPAPAPFKSATPARSFTSVSSSQPDTGVDTSSNNGAAAWGVQLKSSSRGSTPRSSYSVTDIKDQFSSIRLAGETGNDTPADSGPSSGHMTPIVVKSGSGSSPEAMHSSLPGLRHVSNTHNATAGASASAAAAHGDKWDPWRPVSSVGTGEKPAAPASSLQSAVYSKTTEADGSISALMGDITYPPLQAGSKDKPDISKQ
ncbi:hypothetical protein GQ54DRAFT_296326 [Martensiomyces pterosporus]|nr:hypothetical protein GQ54DRAFT_296326 [Martensiomyces pterosporus]